MLRSMPRLDEMPPVPLTLEGAALLHQMARIRWPAWRALQAANRSDILDEASEALDALTGPAPRSEASGAHEASAQRDSIKPGSVVRASSSEALERNHTAAYELLGHKGDIMLVHFRADFDELVEVQRTLASLRLWDVLAQTTSSLSVVELGWYESTG